LPSPLVGINSLKASKNLENPQAAKKWENLIQSDKTLQNRDEKTFKNIEKIIQSHKNIKKTIPGTRKPIRSRVRVRGAMRGCVMIGRVTMLRLLGTN
jgi:hypothetical protein